MKFLSFVLIPCFFLFSSCEKNTPATDSLHDLTPYVNPYIGTGDHGHVFLGANVPFGLVQLGPTNFKQGWDWCSGYHITDNTIIGFGHMHLSGTGIGDLGDISLMPVVGTVPLQNGERGRPDTGFFSPFDRSTEKVKPGYYAVFLPKYKIGVELTSTKRVGFHKYTFPESEEAKVIFDLSYGIGWDTPTEGSLVRESDTVISGYRFSKGWANNQKIYFTAVFSKPMKQFTVAETGATPEEKQSITATRAYGQAHFKTAANEEIYVKVALSPVSIENAKRNLQEELPGWDFQHTIKSANTAWNKELNKILIEAEEEKIKRIFYTSLYHTMIAPSEFCDINGDYRGADGEIHKKADFINYTTFSLWDTYRAAHPLMTIIHPEKMPDIISTMLAIYREQGKLPVWHLMGCETNCMVGNPGICVVADALLKGYGGFDRELAYEAMKTSALLDERGLNHLKKYGYIPYDKENEGLSKCMEYAIADWSLSQAAGFMNKEEDAAFFLNRSKSYKHYFDKDHGLVRGLSSEGKFREKFNPFESVHRDNDYTEGNAWQYTWLVPHDIPGLIDLFGSREAFIAQLDRLFTVQGNLGEHASPDISGLIGQYAHGNEPSHHVIYMYPYAGEPWKTAEKAREILTTLYNDQPEGLCGNEDVGQMSAWYVMSAMGFYQVEPAGGKYIFGSPLIDKAEIKVKGGTFTIHVRNNTPENKYIQSVSLNDEPYPHYYLMHSDLEKGGTLEITMGNTPSPEWGVDKTAK